MAEPATPIFHDLDAFLAWEERQEARYELLPGGAITMMAGGSGDHHQITTNIAVALQPRVMGRPCFVYTAAAKVVSREQGTAVYPDAVVRCGEVLGKSTAVLDPIVVFEVLSESTMKHDLTRKRQIYRAMPTVRVIVYVSQDEYRLDVFRRRADDSFEDEVIEGAGSVLALPEIGAELGLREIYLATSLAVPASSTPAGDAG